jgi:hypothetical protein
MLLYRLRSSANWPRHVATPNRCLASERVFITLVELGLIAAGIIRFLIGI